MGVEVCKHEQMFHGGDSLDDSVKLVIECIFCFRGMSRVLEHIYTEWSLCQTRDVERGFRVIHCKVV